MRECPRFPGRFIDRFGEAIESVTHHDADVACAAVLDLGEDPEPELRASPSADPDPEDVTGPVIRDADGGVAGRLVSWPVADFDYDPCR